MQPTVAVLRLPGVNCEIETQRACVTAGLEATIVRWNDAEVSLADFDAYVLPGGFSYQDRIRAGVVAAKERIVAALIEQVAAGKPVLGICNGAQVLVECGLVPGCDVGAVQVALAPNAEPGYECRWVFLAARAAPGSPFAAALALEEPLPLPVAHAEGRFTSRQRGLMKKLEKNGQLAYCYVDAEGGTGGDHNPNGAELDTAGMLNPQGNALALMPHPERAIQLRQVPSWLPGPWGERRRAARGRADLLAGPGPGLVVFGALAAALRAVRS